VISSLAKKKKKDSLQAEILTLGLQSIGFSTCNKCTKKDGFLFFFFAL
jgi:hypothetical protein